MNNLDLKKLGVQEMDAKEMVDVDGGWAIVTEALKFLGGYVGGKLLDAVIEDPSSLGDKDPTSMRGAYR